MLAFWSSTILNASMKALFLTNEYPPNIYGGAGVHVDYLSRELAKLMDVEVRCFGDQGVDQPHLSVKGFGVNSAVFRCPKNLNSVFGAIRRCIDFNTVGVDADVVHCHTWYSHFGGILAKLNYHVPMVLTVHSLEPLRPWKREQLGYGYDCSTWLEKTATEMADAVVAVSEGTRKDILRLFHIDPARVRIIYNGIDPEEYYPRKSSELLPKYGIDPGKPFVLFVGRIARQKGIIHLVNAIKYMDAGFQIVLCAGAPDTPEIAEEMKRAVAEAINKRDGVVWIDEMVTKEVVYQLYTHAAVFVCPSIYEPFGIINLEAMACETAVVAAAVGGIKEVVVDGETGFLVALEQMQTTPFEPANPDKFARDMAEKINVLMADPALRKKFGEAGRKRAVEKFSWSTIAAETKKMYESLL
jgi:alpha-maltose-1-phosphate synthase